jgi:hypothetical protein
VSSYVLSLYFILVTNWVYEDLGGVDVDGALISLP